MQRLRSFTSVAAVLSMLISGCSAINDIDNTRTAVTDNADNAAQKIADAKSGPTVVSGQVYRHQHQFGGGTALLNAHGSPLPPNMPAFILNSEGAELTLRDIAAEVTAQTHLPVDLDDSLPAGSAKTGPQQGNTVTPASCKLAVNTGKESLPHFMDFLSTWCDMTWRYDGKTRRFKWQQYETVAYSFYATPTKDALSSIMTSSGTAPTSNSGSGGSSQTGSSNGATGQSLNQVTQASADLDPWGTLKGILAPFATPGAVEVAAPHRAIVVTAKHSAQEKIKQLVDELNRRHLREVTFTVQFLDIDTSNNIDLGSSLAAIYNNLQGQYLLSGTSPASLAAQAAGAGSVSVTVQNNTLTGKTSKFATSSAAVQALQNIGHVSGSNTLTAQTIDGKPTGVTLARQVYYFSGSTASQNTSSTLSGVQEQSLTIGLTLQLVPTILDDGQIVLEYNFGLSSLNGLNPTPQGNGQTLDAPDINVQSSMQNAVAYSGDSLVLLGYEQTQLSQTDQGIPGTASSLFGFFSGSKTVQNSRKILVIVITPQLRENVVSRQ